MGEVRSVVVELVAPLNLTVPRASQTKSRRFLSKQSLQWLGVIAPGAVLLSTLKQRSRLRKPAAAALAAGSIAAAVSAAVGRRRRRAREAAIDERVAQSFPASDPAAL
jgi:hypothetical protein